MREERGVCLGTCIGAFNCSGDPESGVATSRRTRQGSGLMSSELADQ